MTKQEIQVELEKSCMLVVRKETVYFLYQEDAVPNLELTALALSVYLDQNDSGTLTIYYISNYENYVHLEFNGSSAIECGFRDVYGLNSESISRLRNPGSKVQIRLRTYPIVLDMPIKGLFNVKLLDSFPLPEV